jgi:hypothetical protein
MKGYSCVKWSGDDNSILINNYVTLDNKQLAAALGRTPDAVRKQLNALKLKRPKKADLKKMDKHVGVADFFAAVKKGLKNRAAKKVIAEKADKQVARLNKERVYAKEVLKTPEKLTDEHDDGCVWVVVKQIPYTRMRVPRGSEAKWIAKFAEQNKPVY